MQSFKKAKKENPKTDDNEIRVSAKQTIRKYIGYATYLLNKEDFKYLKVCATGNATTKALIFVEMLKRKHGHFH